MIISKYNNSGCANLNMTVLILALMILDFKFRIASIHNLRFKTYNYGIFLNNVYRPNASTINNKAPIKAK